MGRDCPVYEVGTRVEILKGEARQPRPGKSPVVSLVGKRGTVTEQNGSGHSHRIRVDAIHFPGDTNTKWIIKWFLNEDFRPLNALDLMAEEV
jgi:hypothetical protein